MKEEIIAHRDPDFPPKIILVKQHKPLVCVVIDRCPCTYQTVTVADGHGGSWGVADVAYVQAVVEQRLCVPGAVTVVVPLHLGSGGHQPGVVVQPQVEFPAKDGDVVVKLFPIGHVLSLRFFPLIRAYSNISPPAPTGLPSCHTAG